MRALYFPEEQEAAGRGVGRPGSRLVFRCALFIPPQQEGGREGGRGREGRMKEGVVTVCCEDQAASSSSSPFTSYALLLVLLRLLLFLLSSSFSFFSKTHGCQLLRHRAVKKTNTLASPQHLPSLLLKLQSFLHSLPPSLPHPTPPHPNSLFPLLLFPRPGRRMRVSFCKIYSKLEAKHLTVFFTEHIKFRTATELVSWFLYK